MKKFLSIILILIVSYSYSQESAFEKKLNLFRFSLNKVLANKDEDKVLKLDFNKNDTIISMINNFIEQNKQEILKYKAYILNKYSNNPDALFEFEKYNKVDVSDISEHLNQFDFIFMAPIAKLLFINPLSEIEMYENIYFSQKKSTKDLAVYKAKTQLTSSIIKTQKINTDQWEIIKDSYDIISKFIYNLKKGKITYFEVFERQKP